ncbi:MAG TPA: phenylalanine--tRNA ligase subunit alpha [Synergistales bacterium]|nr:phenylalanine--tRNA ligase subunit alpha [Synergistales bacterium]HQO82893.1 phenylalanine--tRNA ligase subunit alpha [Synergistales bacterium]HQQ10366.1 phenylalanine--tRNA ligase subunit alpha [Synergistales bacterium]
MGSIHEEVERIQTLFESELSSAGTLDALQGVRVRFLGKKGEVTSLLKRLGSLPAEERPEAGRVLNELRDLIEEALSRRTEECAGAQVAAREAGEWLDVTLPGRGRPWGAFHPVAQITQEAIDIFVSMGFSVAYGPEVEDDFHNFEGLNIPPHHPARDMQDTFYLENGLLLRTHTSPVEVRSMRRWGAPLRIIIPGKVFRRDSDQTHSPMFHQLEGLLVDENVSLAHLKGCLEAFANRIFGRQLAARYRASYFPFTEPSLEMDVECVACSGKNPSCRICKGSGWLEISGMGMTHPNVLRAGGIDPVRYNGFAWGMGLDRIAMLKYGLNDLRVFFEGDLAFLNSKGERR